MSITRALVVVAALAASVVGAPGAGAAGGTRLDCRFTVHLTFSPGISPQVKEIHITSTEPGTLSCTGTWSGREVAGQGLAVFEGDALGSCPGSTIDAVVRMDHPLAGGGRFQVVVPIRSGRLATVLHGTSEDPARPASVLGTGTPDAGQDCARTPITGIAAHGRAVVGPWW